MKTTIKDALEIRRVTEQTLLDAFEAAILTPDPEELIALYAVDRPGFWQVVAERAANMA